jgi:hypothetical protein
MLLNAKGEMTLSGKSVSPGVNGLEASNQNNELITNNVNVNDDSNVENIA